MKHVSWIAAVLIIAFTGDRLAGWMLDKITIQSRFRYSSLYRGDAGSDILLIGNSRGLIFYQPHLEEITGLSTTNLSYNGLPVDLASALVRDYLDRYKDTRLLLIDVTMLDQRMDARLITGFNLYTPYSERLSTLLKNTYPESYYAGSVTKLYRFNSEVFQRALYYLNRSDKDWLLDRVISATMQEKVISQDSFYYDYTPQMLNDLKVIVEYAAQKDVRVELLVNPYFPPFAKKIGNLDKLKKDIQETTGMVVRDYSNSIQTVSGFGDYQHLNKEGARDYLDILSKDGILHLQ